MLSKIWRFLPYLIIGLPALIGYLALLREGRQDSTGGGLLTYFMVGFSVIGKFLGISQNLQTNILGFGLIGLALFWVVYLARQAGFYYKVVVGLAIFGVIIHLIFKFLGV